MCWAMYLFTDNVIDEIKWDDNNPGLFIEKIYKEKNMDYNVNNWNENNKNIYYIGSSQGCGCGWQSPNHEFLDLNDEDEKKEYENKIKDRIELFKILNKNINNGSFFIICWEGDQGNEIKQILNFNIELIKDDNYQFEELIKYMI